MARDLVPRKCVVCQQDYRPTNNKQLCCSNICTLWRQVDKRGPDDCWPWTGKAVVGGSYGNFYAMRGSAMAKRYGRNMTSHRGAYILLKGAIPKGKIVRHKCDNRICCNPRHLLLGTSADNTRDMIKRGRASPLRGFLGWRPRSQNGEIVVSDLMLAAGMTEARRIAGIQNIHPSDLGEAVRRIYESMERWRMNRSGESMATAVVHCRVV